MRKINKGKVVIKDLNENTEFIDMNSYQPESDVKISAIATEDIVTEVIQKIQKDKKPKQSKNLQIILASAEKIKKAMSTNIKFSEAIIKQGENAVIFPNSISVIQGQAGSHKSRLSEIFCAVFLRKIDFSNELLGFSRTNINEAYTVVYVDSERNTKEQLPYAMQSILLNAGYGKSDNPKNFHYISLVQIKRKDRFATLNEYINHIKKSTKNPLFIVLDVATDCIEDFNRSDKSMELIDLMNMAINEHDVSFLCLIHENPKSEKARGHFGTELINKATTVLQVGFEKDANQEDSNIIHVKYKKCRNTAKHTPFYAKYSNIDNSLVLADPNEVSDVIDSRRSKAIIDDVSDSIEDYLRDGTTLSRADFIDKLCKKLNASKRTIEKRISEIMNSDTEFFNENGEQCRLYKEPIGEKVFYKLVILN